MDTITIAASSGLRARAESLEMLANNLANATSPGYKADREFYSTYMAPEALDGPGNTYPLFSPVIDRNWTDHAQGPLVTTGSPLDFSLSGPGFFVIGSASGPLYTRNGSFKLSVDGTLTTQQGASILGRDGKPIRLDPTRDFTVDSEGAFRQGGQIVGQLKICSFSDMSQLTKSEATVFRYNDPRNPAVDSRGHVEQGKLEAANYSPAEAAVRLVSVMRQFEALQRAMSMAADMSKKTIDEVARVRE